MEEENKIIVIIPSSQPSPAGEGAFLKSTAPEATQPQSKLIRPYTLQVFYCFA